MATPAEIVTAIDAALSSNIGVVEMEINGQRVKWDRAQALKMRSHYQSLSNASINGGLPINMLLLRPGAAN